MSGGKYDKITIEEFDRILLQLVDLDGPASSLLQIPGVYELVSEHYNNDVLEAWEQTQEAEADDEA